MVNVGGRSKGCSTCRRRRVKCGKQSNTTESNIVLKWRWRRESTYLQALSTMELRVRWPKNYHIHPRRDFVLLRRYCRAHRPGHAG